MNFFKYGSSVMNLLNRHYAGAYLWAILICICMTRCIEKDSLYQFRQLLELENVGSLAFIKELDHLPKDKIEAGPYQFVSKDVQAKSYIIEEAIPAEKQRPANCDLHKNILSKKSSVAQASFTEGLNVCALRKHFESPAAFVLRNFEYQRPTVVKKDITENI